MHKGTNWETSLEYMEVIQIGFDRELELHGIVGLVRGGEIQDMFWRVIPVIY